MAEYVAKKLGPEVSLRVLSTDSEEARYQGIKSAIAVFVNGQKIAIKEALDKNTFEQIIRSSLQEEG